VRPATSLDNWADRSFSLTGREPQQILRPNTRPQEVSAENLCRLAHELSHADSSTRTQASHHPKKYSKDVLRTPGSPQVRTLRVLPAGQVCLQISHRPCMPRIRSASGSRGQAPKLPAVQGQPDGELRNRKSQPSVGEVVCEDFIRDNVANVNLMRWVEHSFG
jgi:hypothetical protein